ncbi:MAG TPA: histidine kinase [Burkholderiaceae bacterium]|nr:histidine kinase [Burkholderiaceae bacterium]
MFWPQRLKRYPLFTRLLALAAGMAVACTLMFWGTVVLQNFFAGDLAAIEQACEAPAQVPHRACSTVQELQKTWRERQPVMLLLQGGCLVLVLAGALLLLSGARDALIRRADAALALLAPLVGQRPGDEIDRLVTSLRDLAGRQAGFEAEGRWLRHASSELLSAKTTALENLCRTAKLLGENDISELHVVSALGILEQTLQARTVGLRLTRTVRVALAAPEILSTGAAPDILGETTAEPVGTEITARLLPARDKNGTRSLLLPVRKGDLAVGMLAAELDATAAMDDTRVQFAENFARLLGVALSTVIRSHEAQRVALLEERSAIARELHDSLAQSLAYMKIQVARLQHSLDAGAPPASAVATAQELRDGLNGAYREVRELISAFRTQVGRGGIAAALQDIANEFSHRNDLAVSVDNQLAGCRLGINEEFHVLQIVREAITNTVRHAGAKRVHVALSYGQDHRVRVVIEDDGRGLSALQSDDKHYGLSIMRERASSLGGELALEPGEGGGTRVCVTFAPDRMTPEPAARGDA